MHKYLDCRVSYKKSDLKEAALCIRNGELVLFPTETVYGIGANGLDESAVKSIFVAKGRVLDNPLILHVSTLEMVFSKAYAAFKIAASPKGLPIICNGFFYCSRY